MSAIGTHLLILRNAKQFPRNDDYLPIHTTYLTHLTYLIPQHKDFMLGGTASARAIKDCAANELYNYAAHLNQKPSANDAWAFTYYSVLICDPQPTSARPQVAGANEQSKIARALCY